MTAAMQALAQLSKDHRRAAPPMSSNETLAAARAQASPQQAGLAHTSVPFCACGGGCPRCNTVHGADPTAGSTVPAKPAPAQKAAPPAPAPKFIEGSIAIQDSGTTVTPNVGALSFANSFTFVSPFTVSTSGVKIEEPSEGLFQYGLVQNVFFSHTEARYDPQGDMLVDSVGPFVDVWFTETPPFLHEGADNPVLATPGLFGRTATVAAKYTDKPSISFKASDTACNRSVSLKSAKNSLVFRAGLVARDLQHPSRLIPLAATTSTFGFWWDFTVDHPGVDMAYHITTSPLLTGTYALSTTASSVVLGGKRAVEDINETIEVEREAIKTRCESVLDMPQEPLI